MEEAGNEANDVTYELMYGMNALNDDEQQFGLSSELYERMMRNENATLLQEVQVGLEQLIREPEEFETWSRAIKERLIRRSISLEALSLTAEMILQMATLAVGVQYTLSRLCTYLCNEVEGFRQNNLLPELHKYHEVQRSLMSPEQQQNLLLFFAELYDKLELSDGSRLLVLANAVFQQIESMLCMEPKLEGKYVKTVIQVLKLDGRHLESCEDGVAKVNALFTRLNAFAKAHPALSDSVKQQISNLSAFRESSWGTNNQVYKSSRVNTEGSVVTPSSSSNDIIVGPDGQPLSEEERAFVEENIGALESGDSTSDDNDLINEEYEEFLSRVELEVMKKTEEAMMAEGLRKMNVEQAAQKNMKGNQE